VSDQQRFAIDGRVIDANDPQLQQVLARACPSPTRPRCLCIPCGVEMYVARHRDYVIKRMPDTGHLHYPGCPSFEPEASQSGLGGLVGQAVVEVEPGLVELRVDFAWMRVASRGAARGGPKEVTEVALPRKRMSLRALTHFLFERAGFNRWSPAMEGKRNQGVLHKYLMDAADGVRVKGEALRARLYVPEPFSEQRKAEIAQRRRHKLCVLNPRDGGWPMAVVLGEFKACEASSMGRRIWIRHMPDAPLLISNQLWERAVRAFGSILEARDADTGVGMRIMATALIRARREHTYEVESLSLMLASEHWIPVDGVHELPLVKALVEQRRRFLKPLRYDARDSEAFANVLLADAGPAALPLHLFSPFMNPTERQAKERAVAGARTSTWVWSSDCEMPALPASLDFPCRHRSGQ
jgi:hypothetical protein